MVKSSVGPRLIGNNEERNTLEVERGMVSQAPAEEIISTDCRLVSKNLTKRHRQQELRFDWDVTGGTDQVNSLHPALALLDEVRESEGRLLVHLSLDEVEGVPLV